MNSLFADRLTNLQIVANTVRLEFSTFEISPSASQALPQTVVSHVLVMPLDGFVQAFNGQEAVVKKLLDDGILKTMEATSTGSVPVA